MIDIKSKKVRMPVVAVAFFVLLFGLYKTFYWHYIQIEHVEHNEGMSLEAIKNPFLASQMFLEKVQLPAELVSDFTFLDTPLDSSHTYLFTNSRKALSERRLENLKKFAQSGGHLIVVATEIFDDANGASGAPILDELGLRLYENETYDYDAVSEFTFTDAEKNTVVDFHGKYYLVDSEGSSTFIGGSDNGNHVVQYEYGDGLVTVLSSAHFLKNRNVQKNDHAMFLWQLTHHTDKLWVVYDTNVRSLFSLFWQYGSSIIVSFFAFMILLIWYKQIKTAPVFAQFSNVRRQLMQHIVSSAEFKLRHNGHYGLLKSLREDVTVRIKKHVRDFENLPRNTKIEWLEHKTALNRQQIELALFEVDNDIIGFTEQVKLLQQIRNKV
ncbi:DUF4350 domain-containing protein [Pleionea sp. CnH1-48]|uniref:DUF4350 domain-containing protein n=1 Tax=Pleionea sp. CnH1-48 TaxID=2954494 RepID=UPI0020984003|nr:DUF4350 domain-containing protein [Pleionea sp. CnH1-48]MCO7224676.1 DUF4350 domain-containing protein [Pleionea sp. CnH1-48]